MTYFVHDEIVRIRYSRDWQEPPLIIPVLVGV